MVVITVTISDVSFVMTVLVIHFSPFIMEKHHRCWSIVIILYAVSSNLQYLSCNFSSEAEAPPSKKSRGRNIKGV